jgi:hypothetical protein
LVFAPKGTPLEELVRVAGSRWRVESCFEQAKGGFGLDEYEVRRWEAWHRHVTLSLLAHAFLAHAFVSVVSLRETQMGDPRGIRRRPFAPDTAASASPVGSFGVEAVGAKRRITTLVALAKTSPDAGQTLPLPQSRSYLRWLTAAAVLRPRVL